MQSLAAYKVAYLICLMAKIPQSPVYFGVTFSAVTNVDIEVTGAAASQ